MTRGRPFKQALRRNKQEKVQNEYKRPNDVEHSGKMSLSGNSSDYQQMKTGVVRGGVNVLMKRGGASFVHTIDICRELDQKVMQNFRRSKLVRDEISK